VGFRCVGPPPVRVGHCQAPNRKPRIRQSSGFFYGSHTGKPALYRVGFRCVGPPPVRVGHCQAPNRKPRIRQSSGFFYDCHTGKPALYVVVK
jgi:hypothetical protein